MLGNKIGMKQHGTIQHVEFYPRPLTYERVDCWSEDRLYAASCFLGDELKELELPLSYQTENACDNTTHLSEQKALCRGLLDVLAKIRIQQSNEDSLTNEFQNNPPWH